MPPPRSAPGWRARRWRSRSTARSATSPARCPTNGDRLRRKLEIVTERSGQDALELIRHDTAHVLAAAVIELYPGVKISIGPPIENGFYYDFDFPDGVSLSEADFERIEAKMREHIKADEPFVREDVPVGEALERFMRRGPGLQGRADRGPGRERRRAHRLALHQRPVHRPLPRPARAAARSGSRRSSCSRSRAPTGAATPSKPMLTRVYGTAFFSEKDLDAHLERLEQARAHDHRRLGPQLGLFTFSDVAPGSAFWLPDGTEVFNSLVALSREMGASAATPRSRRRSCTTARCGRPRATGTSTARTCS